MRAITWGTIYGALVLSFFGCASSDETASPGPTATTPAGASGVPTVNPVGPSGPSGTNGAPGGTAGGPSGASGTGPVGPSSGSGPGPTGTVPSGSEPVGSTTSNPGPAPSSSAASSSSAEGTTSTTGSEPAPATSEPADSTLPDATGPMPDPGSSSGLPMGNPPVPSAGCGKTPTLTNGKHTITSTGQQRTYIIDIPSGYDANKPHRLFYTSHWIGSTSEAVRDQNYYFLKPLAQAANEPVIFVAPQSDGERWQQKDHALFDDILALVKNDLCIDTTRVFATGFSFGGMITYSLSVNHQKDIRAAVGIAPANYNIWVPEKNGEPIAWMQTTGMSDGLTPWVNDEQQRRGAKFIAIEHATNNGCDVPANIPVWQQGAHVCYDFQGCDPSYPTKVCTFGGDHTNINSDPGSNQNWIATESWTFFMQF